MSKVAAASKMNDAVADAPSPFDFDDDAASVDVQVDESDVVAPAKSAKKVRGPKKEPAKLTMLQMVVAACQAAAANDEAQGLRKASSVSSQAIKKFLMETYSVDTYSKDKNRIRKALLDAVAKGLIVQVKGTGASGSFRLIKDASKAKKAAAGGKKAKEGDGAAGAGKSKKAASKTAAAAAKPKKAAVKKTSAGKKSTTPAKAKATAAAAKSGAKKAKTGVAAKAKGSAVEKKANSPKVRKAPKARKSPVMTTPKAKKTAAKK